MTRGSLLALLAPVVYERAMQRDNRNASRRTRALPPNPEGTLDLSTVPGTRGDEGISDELEAIEPAGECGRAM